MYKYLICSRRKVVVSIVLQSSAKYQTVMSMYVYSVNHRRVIIISLLKFRRYVLTVSIILYIYDVFCSGYYFSSYISYVYSCIRKVHAISYYYNTRLAYVYDSRGKTASCPAQSVTRKKRNIYIYMYHIRIAQDEPKKRFVHDTTVHTLKQYNNDYTGLTLFVV